MTEPLGAVTGATGFIGGHLVNALLRPGRRVRVLVRPSPANVSRFTPQVPAAERAGVAFPEILWGDVQDPAAVERLLQGADLVYHLAACARMWTRDPQEFERVNVGGTENLCRAAERSGVRRLVHVSTELVDGEQTAYQRTKRAAEEIVRAYVARGGDAVIVRPTRVFGPGPLNPANSVTRVMDLYRRGRFRVRIADGGARANYVYVADVVDGLCRAAASGRTGTAYVLGGENLSFDQLLALVAQALGRRYGVLAVPRSVLGGLAALCELGGSLGISPLITRAWVSVLAQDRPMSSQAAEADLGYRPRSAREGIAATLDWLAAGCPAPPPGFSPRWQSA